MKKIVLPTDFSKNAENALVYALNLFKEEKCVFFLLNTYTTSTQYEEYPWHTDLEDSNPQKSMNKLAVLLVGLSAKFKNPKHIFLPHSAMNTVVGEIKKIIERESVDLIIMGAQGATGAIDIIFGSNTTQVVKSINRPVIAIPSDFAYKVPKKVLFPTDFEITYSKEQLKELQFIVERHRSHIAVLHISRSSSLTEDQLANKSNLEVVLQGIDHQTFLVNGNNVHSTINDIQVTEDVNFLVMIQNKHTFTERLFQKSQIKRIGLNIKVPFMVIPYLRQK